MFTFYIAVSWVHMTSMFSIIKVTHCNSHWDLKENRHKNFVCMCVCVCRWVCIAVLRLSHRVLCTKGRLQRAEAVLWTSVKKKSKKYSTQMSKLLKCERLKNIQKCSRRERQVLHLKFTKTFTVHGAVLHRTVNAAISSVLILDKESKLS